MRINKKLSQEQLATITGLSQSFISDIENGIKIPSLTTINKIAHHLKINPFTLLELNSTNKYTLLLFLFLFL